MTETDLDGGRFLIPWGHSRSYGNQVSLGSGSWNGNNWLTPQNQWLSFVSSSEICLVTDLQSSLWFDLVGSAWVVRYGAHVTLTHNTSDKTYTLFDQNSGESRVFFDDDFSYPSEQQGALESITLAGGATANLSYDGVTGRLTTYDFTQDARSQRYLYAYNGNTLLASVTQVFDGATVRRALYTYYASGDTNGNANDLRSVAVQGYSGGVWTTLKNSVYRYYLPTDPLGFSGGLKLIIGPDAFDRLTYDGYDPLSAPDLVIAQYADNYFEYDGARRVTRESINGGAQTYTFAYVSSGFADDFNTWSTKTTMTRNDGSKIISYSNYLFQVIFQILRSSAGADVQYTVARTFDDQGRLLLNAKTEAVAGYSESSTGVFTLNTDAGLIEENAWVASGAGAGRLQGAYVRRGTSNTNGTRTQIQGYTYSVQTVSGNTITQIASKVLYQSDASGGSIPATTTYAYSYFSGSLQPWSIFIYLPSIPTAQNGNGFIYFQGSYYDMNGNNTWSRDELGILTANYYDPATRTLLRQIRDVNTALVSGAPPLWTTPAGAGLNLVTDYEYDLLGRSVQSLGPAHTIDLNGAVTEVRTANYTVYRDDIRETWTAMGYATGTAPGYDYTTLGPVGIIKRDGDERTLGQIRAVRSGDGRLSSDDTFPQSTWTAWTQFFYTHCSKPECKRDYFDILESGDGINGVNYLQTEYGYDSLQRLTTTRSPGGTYTRNTLDARGNITATYVGTDNSGSGTDNMTQVSANQYDSGATLGSGMLTQTTAYVSAPGTTSTTRGTAYGYDWRQRRYNMADAVGVYTENTLDNQDRVTWYQQRFDIEGSGTLLTQSEQRYDLIGRLYATLTYPVVAGSPGDPITASTWYDGKGRVIKRQAAGMKNWTKIVYDGVDRPVANYVSYSSSPDGDTNSVTNDVVVGQTLTTYDAASNVTLRRDFQRFHDATGDGALNGPNAVQPRARIYYECRWPDGIGRLIASANYGTNGGLSMSAPLLIPVSSELVLVSQTAYDEAGRMSESIDPQGTIGLTGYDDLGRVTLKVENFTGNPPTADADKTTQYAYAPDGGLTMLTLKNGVTGDQVTRWEYGTTKAESGVATSRLLRRKIYPGSRNATNPISVVPSGSLDQVELTYDSQSEVVTKSDQNGTVHAYTYDGVGRVLSDRVTVLGSGVDGAVQRIDTAYNDNGWVYTVTSYNAPTGGSQVNQIVYTYDGFGKISSDFQDHGTTSDEIYYTYDGIRMIAMMEANYGNIVNFYYDLGGGTDDYMSRVTQIYYGGESLTGYDYLGVQTIVNTYYNEGIDISLTYVKQVDEPIGDAGDPYNGLDRFGRIQDHRWIQAGSNIDLDRFQYGYTQASLRSWRKNVVAGSGFDYAYTYDGLYQVSESKKGTLNLNRTAIAGAPAFGELWDYDPAGNWLDYRQQSSGITTLAQTRTHNKVNEIRTLDDMAAPIHYDAAGNMTKVPMGLESVPNAILFWDAWNRLARVYWIDGSTGNSSTMSPPSIDFDITYRYDGLSRRTSQIVSYGDAPNQEFYYDLNWKCILSSNLDDSTSTSYVYGMRGRNDLICRSTITASTTEGPTSTSEYPSSTSAYEPRLRSGDVPTRLYALSDAMFSVTSVIDVVGAVQQRYDYTAFGMTTVLTPEFEIWSDIDPFDWQNLFHGEVADQMTGWYNYGYRYYLPQLGRWPSRDPLFENKGGNLYDFCHNSPVNKFDLKGLSAFDPFQGPYQGIPLPPTYQPPQPPPPPESRTCKDRVDCAFQRKIAKDSNTNAMIICAAAADSVAVASYIACLAAGPAYPLCAAGVSAGLIITNAGCVASRVNSDDLADKQYDECVRGGGFP